MRLHFVALKHALATALFTLIALSARGAIAETLPQLFVSSDQCQACHNGLINPHGGDVSIGVDWRAAIMAHSSRDPYWQGAVRREVIDHAVAKAAIENECAKCHMPMSQFRTRAHDEQGKIFAHLPIGEKTSRLDLLAADGVSCTTCHQIQSSNLGKPESFTGGFEIDTQRDTGDRPVFGPYEVDEGRKTIMRSASGYEPSQSEHIQSSEVCATCHTLYTHALGPKGETVGVLPEQVPYLEWKHSAYYQSQSCQSCHMRTLEQEMPISSVWAQPREQMTRHVFRGGNVFMLHVLNNYREVLGVQALPQELDAAAQRTALHLQSSSGTISLQAEISGDQLLTEVFVENLAGHKLPTAYPSRRTWIHLTVKDANSQLVFESGALDKDGSIVGNDNDLDPTTYEPHYSEITSAEQVQIYEPILGTLEGHVTTGLLSATHYLKDNRLLPHGFDKESAPDDVAVHGDALADEDFEAGGDTIRYRIPIANVKSPLSVQVELWYQPIGFRWAHNLDEYEAPEPQTLVALYESMSDVSAIRLTEASAEVEVAQNEN